MREFMCLCVTHHGTALAAATAHLAVHHNERAQLIRPQSEAKEKIKMGRGKEEMVKRGREICRVSLSITLSIY